MIAIPLVGVRYRLPRGHGRSNDKRKSEQLIQRVFKSPLELNRARPARATCPPLAGSLFSRSPAYPHSLGAALAQKEHPNSIRHCFKHGCAGRILHSGRTEGGPLQHYRSDTHRCCMSRHLWGQRKAVGLIHDRRLCCLYNRGPGSPHHHAHARGRRCSIRLNGSTMSGSAGGRNEYSANANAKGRA